MTASRLCKQSWTAPSTVSARDQILATTPTVDGLDLPCIPERPGAIFVLDDDGIARHTVTTMGCGDDELSPATGSGASGSGGGILGRDSHVVGGGSSGSRGHDGRS